MSTCPTCHGSTREPIAPGFWRCSSPVSYAETILAPQPGVPPHLGQMIPQTVWRTRICGREYHEGAGATEATQQCECGTYAIGACSSCGTPICGTHSALHDGRRLCLPEFNTAQEEAAAEQARRDAAAVEERLAAQRNETLMFLRAIADADERFFLAAMMGGGYQWHGLAIPTPDQLRELIAGASTVLAGPSPDPSTWDWDAGKVVAWLRTRPTARPIEVTEYELKLGRFGRRKRVLTGRWDGWVIGRRSSGDDDSHYRRTQTTWDICLLESGDIVELVNPGNAVIGTANKGRHKFDRYYCVGMAKCLGLPRPDPKRR